MNAEFVPPSEVRIDSDLVTALLHEQFPDLATLPVRQIDAGFDNAIFRLGDSFAARLPRRAAAAPLVEIEQRWLTSLSNMLPLAVPAPLFIGRPGCGFPWHWSVVPWIVGMPADLAPMDASEAPRLGKFLRALHLAAPAEAPHNPLRGVPLTSRASFVEETMLRLALNTEAITAQVRDTWRSAVQAPLDVVPTWIHGDMHPRNVLTLEGRLAGVLDWGDMCSGDRATDLAAIWMLLTDPAAREAAMRAYGPATAATWLRARGWALFFGVVLLETGLAGNVRNVTLGTRILRHL